MTDPLFDGFDEPVVPDTATPGQRRRARQDAFIAAGLHPLTGPTGQTIRLLPPPDDVPAGTVMPPSRCGDCVHRIMRGGAAKSYPKCDLPGRSSRGEATDVRAWWPACVDYELEYEGKS